MVKRGLIKGSSRTLQSFFPQWVRVNTGNLPYPPTENPKQKGNRSYGESTETGVLLFCGLCNNPNRITDFKREKGDCHRGIHDMGFF